MKEDDSAYHFLFSKKWLLLNRMREINMKGKKHSKCVNNEAHLNHLRFHNMQKLLKPIKI